MTNPNHTDTSRSGDLIERLRGNGYNALDNLELHAEAADRIAALEAKLAEKDALLRKCGEGLAGPNAWLERWASHVGGCHGGSLCQCGLTLACLESATTLAKIKDATDAD